METTAATTAPARRRLRQIGSTFLVAAALVIGAAACQPVGCAQDCVNSLTINPGATIAQVTTTVKASLTIEIFTNPGMTTLVSKRTTVASTGHMTAITPLAPKTAHWYRITAKDENGNTWVDKGSFTTKARKVAVTINRIKLIDDSDSVGSGELTFHLNVNGTSFVGVYKNNDMASDDEVKNLTITRTVDNTPNPLTFKVEGSDDDCDAGLCTGGTQPSWTSGSTGDADWATGTYGAFTAPAGNSNGTWSVSTRAHALKFDVWGTWTVTYV